MLKRPVPSLPDTFRRALERERPRPLRPAPEPEVQRRVRAAARRATGRRPKGLRALGRIDQNALRALRVRGHTPAVEAVMKTLGAMGEWGAVWIALGAAGAALDRERRPRWLAASIVAPASVIANFGVKLAVGRRRPLLEDHPPLARAPSKLSFPSAHATSSLAAATALGRVEPAARPALYGLASAICFSRSYLGMHYPSDVLAGAALGLALGRIAPGLEGPGPEDRLIDLVVSRSPSAGDVAGNGAPVPAATDAQVTAEPADADPDTR